MIEMETRLRTVPNKILNQTLEVSKNLRGQVGRYWGLIVIRVR